METSKDNASGVISLEDSNGLNVIEDANNTCDSKKIDSEISSPNIDAENTILGNSTSNTKNISDNCNLQTKLINNANESVSDTVQEVQSVETIMSNDHLENKESRIEDENDLNLPGNVKNVFNRIEQSADPDNSARFEEMQSDIQNNGNKSLEIISEQPCAKTGDTNDTNLKECTSDKLAHNSNSFNGKFIQFVNQEKIHGSVTKDSSSNNNDVEAMITEDHVESETGKSGWIIENVTSPDNNFPTHNEDAEQSRDQEQVNENKETNENPNQSIDNSEPMVTDDPSEKEKVINEIQNDIENSSDMNNGMEGIRNANVVEAMNKDQLWKTDKVYKKDLRSLKLLCDYGSDSDDDDDDDNEETKEDAVNSNKTVVSSVPAVNPCPTVNQEYREPEVVSVSESEESDSSDETSSTSSATSSSSSDETEESDNECVVVEEKVKKEVPKTKGELGLEDLPPIEDLHITVPESECMEIGKVLSIVDSLVVVQSLKGCPALDLDSVLFLDHGHNALGEVFDVFGKVGEACYCVRFNSKDHALKKGVEVGMPVYYAPRTEYSRYVFLADLTKMKGSDASWAHNNEPPPRYLDYSDDEQERKAKKGNKPPVRHVEREESQPQAKRFYRRGPNRGGANGAPTSPRSNRSWATPFNRYVSNRPSSPPQSPSPGPGPKPLIRPSSFRNSGPPPPYNHPRSFAGPSHSYESSFQPPIHSPLYRNSGPPQSLFHEDSEMGGPSLRYRHPSSFMSSPPPSHFHNAAAGAPPMPGPSSQMLSPQFGRADFKFDMNVPPPQPAFGHNQMGPNSMNMNDGGFRQGPPPTNVMRPTSIPNPGLFAVETSNGFKAEVPPSFSPNQPTPMRHDFRGSFGEGPPRPFGGQQPVFMNPNVPPPPTHQLPPPRQPHMGW